MRLIFTPSVGQAPGLLTLPWERPLADWADERLAEIRQRGISRHVVRFVCDDGTLYALKELSEQLARREYRLLRALAELNIPAVKVVGIAADRDVGDAILVTRYLNDATTYRTMFTNPGGRKPADKLLDALAELLVRLHLSGFFWGDCSLSNALFRYDAGTLEAYLVDAETSEQHAALSKGQRCYDVELAVEQVFGELADLQAGGLLPTGVDPLQFAKQLAARYKSLWGELTREQVLRPEEEQYEIVERLRRLNELGFDVDEVELVSTRDGSKLRLRTQGGRPRHRQHPRRPVLLHDGADRGAA